MISANVTESPSVEQIVRSSIVEVYPRPPQSNLGQGVTSTPSVTKAWQETGWPRGGVGSLMLTQLAVGRSEATGVYNRDLSNVAASRIRAARQPDVIVEALSLAGHTPTADRIGDLHEMTKDGAPDEPPIVLPSLRELALFLVSESQFPDPEIGLSPDGLMLAEWTSLERGVLAMKFLPDEVIQFAAVSPAGRKGTRLRVAGSLPKDRALEAVRAFIP